MTAERDPLQGARGRVSRLGAAALRQSLHKVLVLWDLGYLREALGQFRLHAEGALSRIVSAQAEAGDLAEQLSRGRTAKVVERLYEERAAIPARVALHLHTLLAWGNYASHHQRRGHHARGSDLALLISVTVELEGWVAATLEQGSIFDEVDAERDASRVTEASAAAGLDLEVARAFVRAAGAASVVSESYRLAAPRFGVELLWRLPSPVDVGASGERSPYRGLAPFEPHDADRFYGRDELASRLVVSVDTKRLTLVSGASGAGKTSLLRAALVPALIELGCGVLLISDCSHSTLDLLEAVEACWGPRPLVLVFDQLERALLADVEPELRRRLLRRALTTGETSAPLAETRRDELALEGPPTRADAARQLARTQARRVVLGIREDFLGRLLREARAVDDARAVIVHQDDAFVAVGPLDAAETREAMVRPLDGSGVALDEALVRRLLDELASATPRPQGDATASDKAAGTTPARLQIVCERLWKAARRAGRKRIDEALYDELGGAETIFAGYLDEVLDGERYDGTLLGADVERRDLARAVLRAMTGPEARRWVDLGALWSALPPTARADELELRAVLDQLVADRLVVSRGPASDLDRADAASDADGDGHALAPGGAPVVYSLMHDQLVAVVRGWTSAAEHELGQAEDWLEHGVRAYDETGEVLRGRRFRVIEARLFEFPRNLRTLSAPLVAASRRARRLRRAGVAVLLGVAALGLVFGVVQLRRAVVQRDRAVVAADQGVLLRARLEMERDPTLALAWLRNLSRRTSALGVRTLLEEARRRGVARVLTGHEALVTSLAFTPDGRTLVSASRDRTVRTWSVAPSARDAASKAGAPGAAGRRRTLFGHVDFVSAVAVSPDGRLIASGGWDNSIRLWSAKSGKPRGKLGGHTGWVYGLAFSPNGKTLVSVGADATLRRWDVARRRQRGEALRGHSADVVSVTYSPNGKLIASASLDKTVRLYRARDGAALEPPLRGHAKGVYGVAFTPDGHKVATASLDGTVRLFDVDRYGRAGVVLEQRGAKSVVLARHAGGALAVAFSPDGRVLASAGADKLVHLVDVRRRRTLGEPLRGHLGYVRALRFSPDGRALASASRDHTIRLWNLEARRRGGLRLRGHGLHVQALAFSPDGRTLASASRDGSIRRWSVRGRRARGAPLQHGSAVFALAYAPRGDALVSGSADGRVRLFRWPKNQLAGPPPTAATTRVVQLGRSRGPRYTVAFSPDGTRVAAGGEDGTIVIYDVRAQRADGPALIGHSDAVFALGFAPDGETLASAGRDGTILLWRKGGSTPQSTTSSASSAAAGGGAGRGSGAGPSRRRGQPRYTLTPALAQLDEAIYALSFSPDGRTLACGSGDGTVRLYDTRTRSTRGEPLVGHRHWVLSVAFAPDGTTLASGSSDGSVRLWDLARHRPLGPPLRGHSDWVYALAFSPDGRTLASGSADRTIWLWQLANTSLRDLRARIDGLTNVRVDLDGHVSVRRWPRSRR